MTKNLDKEGLSSIADNYQLFYVDLWGVIHNGISLYNDAIVALKEISKKKKGLCLTHQCSETKHNCKNLFRKTRFGKRN